MDESSVAMSLKGRTHHLLALQNEWMSRTESKSTDANHLNPCQGGSSIEKRIRNSLETETHNPVWRVSIFSAIPAISNQRLLEQFDHLLMINLTAVWAIH